MSDSNVPPVQVPTIETARLRLRPHRRDDFEPLVTMWADPAVVRYFGGTPTPRDEVWVKLQRIVGHWQLVGYGYWALEDKATGRFVGELGYADNMRAIEPSFDGIPEIGWALTADVHGRGLATEAVKAVVAWGDEKFGAAQTWCMINPDNAPSIRVAEKFGYKEQVRTAYKSRPITVFVR
jgi:RimJ/RimL family protein N-acetyltransferase